MLHDFQKLTKIIVHMSLKFKLSRNILKADKTKQYKKKENLAQSQNHIGYHFFD
jgi:hypothetical protein